MYSKNDSLVHNEAQLSGTLPFFHSKYWVYVRVGGDGMDLSNMLPSG